MDLATEASGSWWLSTIVWRTFRCVHDENAVDQCFSCRLFRSASKAIFDWRGKGVTRACRCSIICPPLPR
eukprot:363079-Chlamydomonas_euryale.AAC.2